MKRKTLAVAAIIFASILAIAPAAALSIDTLIDEQSTLKTSDVSALESGEKYCLANATVANDKAVISYYDRIEGECAFTSSTETKTIEIPILVENEALLEQYAEAGVEEGSTVTIEDLDLVSAAADDATVTDLPNYNHDVKTVNEANDSELAFDAQSIESVENFDLKIGGDIIAEQGDVNQGIIPGVKLDIRSVIYIPESTDETPEAYAEAAQSRAQNATEKAVDIKYAGKIANICTELEMGEKCEAESDLAKELGTEDYYFFIIEENGVKTIVLVVKDDEQVSEYDTAYGIGGMGESTEEQPIEESVVIATATSEEVKPEPIVRAQSKAASTIAYSAPNYTQENAEPKEEEKPVEQKTEPVQPAEEQPEEEDKNFNPAPLIVCGAIFVIAVTALALKRNGKKYSK